MTQIARYSSLMSAGKVQNPVDNSSACEFARCDEVRGRQPWSAARVFTESLSNDEQAHIRSP